MSTFKRGNAHAAASPLGLGALALVWGCFAFTGCPVDDRSLVVNAGGTGGSGSSTAGNSAAAGTSHGGTTSAGTGGISARAGEGGVPSSEGGSATQGGTSNAAGSGPQGGTSGQSGAPDPGGDGCPDLDEDNVGDCEQTVAQNARFMTDVTGWEAEPTLHQAWDARDASETQASGALLVRNTNAASGTGIMLSGSRQCVPIEGQQAYSVAAKTFIPSGQGEGSAGIYLTFFASDGCNSSMIGPLPVQLVSEPNVWAVVRGKFNAPGGARSMHLRLVTSKPFAQPSMEALFDDVLVRQE